jgi:hypothetical protein
MTQSCAGNARCTYATSKWTDCACIKEIQYICFFLKQQITSKFGNYGTWVLGRLWYVGEVVDLDCGWQTVVWSTPKVCVPATQAADTVDGPVSVSWCRTLRTAYVETLASF